MSLLSEMVSAVRYAFWARNHIDDLKIIGGSALSRLVNERESYASISELEFKVFSQFGDERGGLLAQGLFGLLRRDVPAN